MRIWLYRRRLSLLSGAGQLVQMQAEGLERAGFIPQIASERRRLKYLFRTGRRIRALPLEKARSLARDGADRFVDHSGRVPEADLVFVHNLAAVTAEHLPQTDLATAVAEERACFAALDPAVRVVANSKAVREAIIERFGLADDRVDVLYPGYRAARFDVNLREHWRKRGRRELGLAENVPLVGFVSSGNFTKRGLDHLLESAARIHAERPGTRFLVVGSSGLPESARDHRLLREKVLRYRPKSRTPERWYAALDLFLYPAEWEEFGLVVTEAQAMGLPVLTTRRVGAAECLPEPYQDWLGERPDAERLAADALRLLDDPGKRAELVAAGLRSVRDLDDVSYGDRAAALILGRRR